MATVYIRRNDGKKPPRTGAYKRVASASRSRGTGSRAPSRGGSRSGAPRAKRNFQEMSVDLSKLINKAQPVEEVETFTPIHTFSDFEVSEALKDNVAAKGYALPTPIQDQSIPHVLAGKDIVGIANTGTGKTAAFLIPLIDKVQRNREERVLIMVPTRELAIQIEEEFYGFAKRLHVHAVTCVGGAGIEPQLRGLRRGPNFVIGTPGRLKDLIERGALNLGSFNTVVLDEADRMLDMGFIGDMREIMALMPAKRHTLFFSATLSREIEALIGAFLNDPVRVSVKTRDTAHTIDQDVVRVEPGRKFEQLVELLNEPGFDKVLVFGRTKHGVERLTNDLNRAKVPAESIHGDKTHGRRQKALGLFKQDKVRVLVATDVAARGLDITGVSHVINYDLPATYEDYTHRIGRTGRAGKTGKALTFIEQKTERPRQHRRGLSLFTRSSALRAILPKFTGTMTDLLKMDIFFVVATAATAAVAAGIIVALVYAVRLLRTMNRVADEIEEEAGAIRKDIMDARESVRGFRFSDLFTLFKKRKTSKKK